MSQAGPLETVGGSPTIPTEFDTNAGMAVPAANILNILGDNTQGINITGSGNTVTVVGINASTSQKGVASFNPADFSVTSGVVSLISSSGAYTAINAANSPYTVLSTDYYISVDSSGGPVTINLPNAPNANTKFIIKDRTGSAFGPDTILVKSLGGITTVDQQPSVTIQDPFESISLLYHSANYEIY